jgi:thioredoxin-dependent peroxiredoxin
MCEERIDEAFSLEERLTVVGKKLQPGQVAPDFLLDYVDIIDLTVHQTCLADSAGAVRVLSIINSLDMPICGHQTCRWDELCSSLPHDICLYTISMDLPHTQVHWQVAEKVIHQALSAHRSEQFGVQYGVLLKEWRLLQRSVFVIDRHDRVIYAEYVGDQQREPDYDAALAAVFQVVTSL